MAAIAGVSVVFAVRSISDRSIGQASSYVGGKSFYVSISGSNTSIGRVNSEKFQNFHF